MLYCLEANLMKEECLWKFVLIVSDIIYLAIQLMSLHLFWLKVKVFYAKNVILGFTCIVLKITWKYKSIDWTELIYYTILLNIPEKLRQTFFQCVFEEQLLYFFHSFFFCVDILNPSVGNKFWVSISMWKCVFGGQFSALQIFLHFRYSSPSVGLTEIS